MNFYALRLDPYEFEEEFNVRGLAKTRSILLESQVEDQAVTPDTPAVSAPASAPPDQTSDRTVAPPATAPSVPNQRRSGEGLAEHDAATEMLPVTKAGSRHRDSTPAPQVAEAAAAKPERMSGDPWRESLYLSPAADRPDRKPWEPTAAWLVPALLAEIAGGLGLARPSLWTDELQTWGMSGTPWSQFWPVLRWVDAVLAPYYVAMHLWASVAGTSDIAMRFPSVAAMIGAAALVGLLGTRPAGPRVGLIAGVVFAVLPGVSRYGQEARPYALTAFASVLATYLLVVALNRPARWRWAAYALAVAALGLLHVVAVLLLVGHAWLVLAWRRPLFKKWFAAAVLGLVPLLPVLWLGARQRNQVAYIPHVGLSSFLPTTTAVFGSLAVGLVVMGLAGWALPLRWPTALYTTWAVVSTATLVVVSLVMPLFLPRYLVFTLPAWALLAGTALARLRPLWTTVAVILIAALGLPSQLAIRHSDGHDEATRDAAKVIATHERPGDAAVYATNEQRGGWTTRDLAAHYIPADRRPRDVLLTRPPRTDGQLLAGECTDVAKCLGRPARVWVVRLGEQHDPLHGLGEQKEALLRQRYREDHVWRLRNMTLALLVLNTRRP